MAIVTALTKAISDDWARVIADTPIGPVTIEASRDGLCGLDFPDPGALKLDALWADLGLPNRTPLPNDTLADFGLNLPFVEIDPDWGAGDCVGERAGDGFYAVPPLQGFSPEEVVRQCREVLERLFACDINRKELSFSSLPVCAEGLSSFGRLVSEGMRAIPGAAVTSYSSLARAAGSPRAPRGVGAVVGANRVSLIVPCHRVVGVKGALTGYGGSLPLKLVLLALEQRMAARAGA